jgi:putative alpha-1,2-mannosidase
LPGNRHFIIQAVNLSKANKYVESISLNGRIYTKPYITYKDIMNGGNLVFTMTNKPATPTF